MNMMILSAIRRISGCAPICRAFSVLWKPLRIFQPLTELIEVRHVNMFNVFANPQMQETLLKLVEVGREFRENE
jgi:hypothetical protein